MNRGNIERALEMATEAVALAQAALAAVDNVHCALCARSTADDANGAYFTDHGVVCGDCVKDVHEAYVSLNEETAS